MAAKSKAHPGWTAAASSIMRRQGVSRDSANRILGRGARSASKGAIRRNPRLKRVAGVGKRKKK